MSSAPLIVSISGIRGLVGQSLTDEVVARFASAFGTTLRPGDAVVLARDTRPSGAAFAQAAAAALRQTGCRVFDLGTCSTPGAKLMIAALNAAGAIIITASHNPAPWNGLKLVRADGVFLNAEEGGRVEALFHAGEFRCAASGELATMDSDAVVARHVRQIVDYVDADAIRRAGFKVAVDPCNGTGALVVPSLLDALGVEAVLINARPDGDFTHDPEPVPANLVQLGQAVRDNSCAVGFAIDPDCRPRRIGRCKRCAGGRRLHARAGGAGGRGAAAWPGGHHALHLAGRYRRGHCSQLSGLSHGGRRGSRGGEDDG